MVGIRPPPCTPDQASLSLRTTPEFDITHNNREPLTYLVVSSPASKPEPEAYPKSLTQPDLDKLIKDLHAVIPGIRLSERLKNIKDASHQAITDFLSDHGPPYYAYISVYLILRRTHQWPHPRHPVYYRRGAYIPRKLTF